MHISALCVSAFSLAVSVDALVHRVPPVSAAFVVQGVEKRQVGIASMSSSTPPQCASTCSPVNNEVSLKCPVTACCTTTFQTQYYNCLECVGSALDASNYAAAQTNLNLLYMTCVDMGFLLPQLALPGQTANDSGSTVGSAVTPFAGGSSTASSSGAVISSRTLGGHAKELMGAAMLLGAFGLWR